MWNDVEWTILEVDEAEWQRHTHTLDSAAAAGSFPMYVAPQQQEARSHQLAPTRGEVQQRRRQAVLMAAAVLVLAVAVVGYSLWRSAQHGITRLQSEVANVVKLETVKAHAEFPGSHEQAAVETVEFLGEHAMVQAVISRTLASGQVVAQRQVLFYVKTPRGWRRSEPIAAFSGEPQALDTSHLHFVFRSKDRAAVEQLAPGTEALYVFLRRATGQTLGAPGGRLTIEVVPERIHPDATFENGRMRLASPLLYELSLGHTIDTLLALQMRQTMANEILDRTLRNIAVKPQWQLMVEGLRLWLLDSDALPLAPAMDRAASWMPADSFRLSDLGYLLSCQPCTNSDAGRPIELYSHSEMYTQQQRIAVARSLVDFIVTRYGIDALPALLHAFNRYDDWETLVPAVLGVGSGELEVAWLASRR